MIKEIIVVEGRDDVTAVKRALDCELITTGGFGFPKGVMERIKAAQKRRGVIIFTDPDFAGEKIRKKIAAEVPGCKHAFLPREEAKKDGDIGIENASPESILRALNKVRTESTDKRNEFSQVDFEFKNATMDDILSFIENRYNSVLISGQSSTGCCQTYQSRSE